MNLSPVGMPTPSSLNLFSLTFFGSSIWGFEESKRLKEVGEYCFMAGENVGLMDRISELPDEARERILGYLPVREAAKTSVLSRKWRFSWTRVTQLNVHFDEHEMSRDRFCRLVGLVLLSHVGPIHKFFLHLLWRNIRGDMNTWVRLLSRKGIMDLTIQGDQEIGYSDVPSSLYQCLGLSSLTLDLFELKDSVAFRGFPNLVRLELLNIKIYGDILEKIISGCPLEMLLIDICNFNQSINIFAPNLRILEIICHYQSLDYSLLKYTPNLRVASFGMDPDMCGDDIDYLCCNCFDVLRSMPKIEVLTFDCPLHKTSASDTIPKRLPEPLGNLKTLTLHDMDVTSIDQLSFMYCIIRSSPNLQTVNIHMRPDLEGPKVSEESLKAAVEFLKARAKDDIKTTVTTLTVTLQNRYCMEAYTSLIVSIVSDCPVLRELFIKPPPSLTCCKRSWLNGVIWSLRLSASKLKIILSNSVPRRRIFLKDKFSYFGRNGTPIFYRSFSKTCE